MPAGIQINGLEVSFGRKRVIKGVDLCIPVGEITALIGPSGVVRPLYCAASTAWPR